jgi:hypothetical protein
MGCGKNADAVGSDDTTTSDEEDDEVRTSSFAVSDLKSPAALAVAGRRERYCLVACKQMVGLFATVWVRRGLVPHVGHVRFSCVGRGIMGYLGNKVSSQQSRLIQSDPLQLNCLKCHAIAKIMHSNAIMCLVSGLHLCQHVAAPDELVLRVQPPGLGGEGRRRAQEELRCGRDPQEHAVPQALQEIRPQDPRENSRP